MTEQKNKPLSWVFVVAALVLGITIFNSSWTPVNASDHDHVRELRFKGKIIPLRTLLEQVDDEGMTVIEAELEREHGQLVYELELLDTEGRIIERYYDAVTGKFLKQELED